MFFRAISAQGDQLLILNADNQGRRGWWQDLDTDQGYAAFLANEGRFKTVALDFDAKKAGPDAAVADAECALHLLGLAGIQAVVCASGSLGGRHVLLTVQWPGLSRRTAFELVDRLIKVGLSSLDRSNMSNPVTGAIRPPLAPRRQGYGRSRPLAPLDDALAVLVCGNPPEAISTLVDALSAPGDRRPALRGSGVDTELKALREYDTGSHALLGVATRAVNSGMAEEAFTAMVEAWPVNDAIRGHLERQGAADRRRRAIERAWRKAVEFVQQNPAIARTHVDDDAVIREWCEVDVGRLHGAQGRVALVLRAVAVACGRRLVGLSVRTAAERAGVSRSVAAAAIQRLTDAQVIAIADAESSGRARRFRLNPVADWDANARRTVGIYPFKGGGGEPTVSTGFGALSLANDVAAEVWSSRGLGEARRKVYRALVDATQASGTASVTHLAGAMRITPQVVGRHLRVLEQAQLARRVSRSEWAPEVRSTDDLSFALGVVGVNADRAARHARERREEAVRRVEHRLQAKGVKPVVQVAYDPGSRWAILAEDLGCGSFRTVDGVSGVPHRARARGNPRTGVVRA